MRGEGGEDLADFDAALAVLAEAEGRGEQVAGLAFGLEITRGQGLAGVFRQCRLGVEGVHLRGSAIEEEEDDAFGAGGEVRRAWAERRAGGFGAEYAGQSERAESGAHGS